LIKKRQSRNFTYKKIDDNFNDRALRKADGELESVN